MASQDKPFVHLRVHSAYSLLEGALTIPKLAALAHADGAPALALTDTDTKRRQSIFNIAAQTHLMNECRDEPCP